MSNTVLGALMEQVSIEMTAALAKSRIALSHKLSQGEAGEEPVRKFLREHLPQSVGVTTGQVIDARGERSRQVDVIVYDVSVVPILYTSEEGGHQLVPSEGVIAVVEVKSRLKVGELGKVFENMKSVKGLQKSSYYETNSIVRDETQIYGKSFSISPTLYFVFAYESEKLDNITKRYRELVDGCALESRVDSICVLNTGVVLFQNPTTEEISGLPAPATAPMSGHAPKHALLLFYLLVVPYLLQIRFKPIDMLKYIPTDFDFMTTGEDEREGDDE